MSIGEDTMTEERSLRCVPGVRFVCAIFYCSLKIEVSASETLHKKYNSEESWKLFLYMKIKYAPTTFPKGSYCTVAGPLCDIAPVLSILEKELESSPG